MQVTGRIASLTLKEPFAIARGTQTEAEVVWVEIEHEGERGYGEAAPIERYDESAESAVAYVEQPLPAGDPGGLQLKMESPLPIFVDEDCHTLLDVHDCAQRSH